MLVIGEFVGERVARPIAPGSTKLPFSVSMVAVYFFALLIPIGDGAA
jgi:hypothetical protein